MDRLLHVLTEIAGRVESPVEALREALDRLCVELRWPLGHVYRLLEGDAPLLVTTGLWHPESSTVYPVFRAASETTTFARGTGLVGAVWESGRPRQITLGNEPGFVRAEAARAEGLCSALAFPVLIGMEVVAVIELFDPAPRTASAEVEETLRAAGVQLGRVFERDRVRLQESSGELRAMIEAEPACIKLIGADGTVLDTNRAGYQMLDADRAEEVVGTNVVQYISADDREKVIKIVERVFQGETRSFTFEGMTTKGRLRCFETTAAPFPKTGGAVNRILTVTRDITEARELEEQYRQAQKMEAIGRLAGGIAHDFNNMLGVINGYSELLLEMLPPENSMRAALGEIARAGDRAANLTRQLLAFSRKESVEPRVLDLKGVVGELRQMLSRLIGEDVSLVTEFESGANWVRADPGQIEQLLLNLVVNSRDALPHGGRITLTLRNEELTVGPGRVRPELAPGKYVRLTVADNGCGMDRSTLERVFEPFFTTKPAGQGTGLGLATVFGIIQQSGGSIAVESEVGRGTTFDIFLPWVEPIVHPDAVPVDAPRRGFEVVLLVEDEPLVRKLVESILAEYGYSVILARNGDEALREAEAHPGTIHMLLTDVVIPGSISARTLAEELSTVRPELCVLYMSGYMDDAVVRAGVGGPATHFIQKPFAPSDLARKVREVLDAGPWHANACRILIIDDDRAARESLAEVLEAEGYVALTATSGREGLEMLRAGPRPDLILLDLVMPGMNGWAFRSEQEKDPELAEIPVVIVSGAHDPAPAAGFLRTALSLSKPLDIPRLLHEIERHCRRSSNG